MTTAVIGGAGYIGAHVVALLKERNEPVVIVDDLSTGLRDRVEDIEMLELNISGPHATEILARFFKKRAVKSVMHFAAKKQVFESVRNPLWYYEQNIAGTANVLHAAQNSGVQNFVFSSSAAVYGSPEVEEVKESYPTSPINPYGETKLVGEWLVNNVARAAGMRAVSLRYFNVVGARSPLLADRGEFNLVPIALSKAQTDGVIEIFGDDYPTYDGTCIRDYVHVADLADSHIVARDFLVNQPPGTHNVYNVGTGQGTSVKQVIDLVQGITGIPVKSETAPRRPGDPPSITANVDQIREDLDWKARWTVEEAIQTAWEARLNDDPEI